SFCHRVTRRRHSSGISDRTLIRALTSSPRLVSWVEVADSPCGYVRCRSTMAVWNSASGGPKRLRAASSLVDRHEPVEPVERGVLVALGGHRRGDLLEPPGELQPFPTLGLGRPGRVTQRT